MGSPAEALPSLPSVADSNAHPEAMTASCQKRERECRTRETASENEAKENLHLFPSLGVFAKISSLTDQFEILCMPGWNVGNIVDEIATCRDLNPQMVQLAVEATG